MSSIYACLPLDLITLSYFRTQARLNLVGVEAGGYLGLSGFTVRRGVAIAGVLTGELIMIMEVRV